MTRTNARTHRRFSTAAARWAAVLRRDPRADGCFVTAVRTTGIFCRPSCPSRPPRRENVRFFDSPDEARRAGFRACKRCNPTEPLGVRPREALIRQACHRLEHDMIEPTLAELAQSAGMSPHHFQRTFKAAVGLTPKQFAKSRRFDRFRAALRRAGSVTAAIHEAGYSSASRVYDRATAKLAMTPAAYRNRGVGETVEFAIRRTVLGWIIVAGTRCGVAHIAFGDGPGRLRDELQAEYSRATLHENTRRSAAWASAVEEYLKHPARGLKLPLELHGTDFQQKVWSAIAQIPVGRTLRYSELAAALGQPRATRAVARACAANRVALAIPCHRVVPADPARGGYRWGRERKAHLLAAERSAH